MNKVTKKDFKKLKKEALMIEEHHPAVGRILIVDGAKFRVMEEPHMGQLGSGTFIKPMTQDDEDRMEEYDEALETYLKC